MMRVDGYLQKKMESSFGPTLPRNAIFAAVIPKFEANEYVMPSFMTSSDRVFYPSYAIQLPDITILSTCRVKAYISKLVCSCQLTAPGLEPIRCSVGTHIPADVVNSDLYNCRLKLNEGFAETVRDAFSKRGLRGTVKGLCYSNLRANEVGMEIPSENIIFPSYFGSDQYFQVPSVFNIEPTWAHPVWFLTVKSKGEEYYARCWLDKVNEETGCVCTISSGDTELALPISCHPLKRVPFQEVHKTGLQDCRLHLSHEFKNRVSEMAKVSGAKEILTNTKGTTTKWPCHTKMASGISPRRASTKRKDDKTDYSASSSATKKNPLNPIDNIGGFADDEGNAVSERGAPLERPRTSTSIRDSIDMEVDAPMEVSGDSPRVLTHPDPIVYSPPREDRAYSLTDFLDGLFSLPPKTE